MATLITENIAGRWVDGLSLITSDAGMIWAGEFVTTLGDGKVADFVTSAFAAGAKLEEVRLFNSETQELIIAEPIECVVNSL